MRTNTNHKLLNNQSLAAACRSLSEVEPIFAHVHGKYQTPPLWERPQGFATLLYIILEQQVSLASAKACFDKLVATVRAVTPESLLKLNDADLKTIGFSRQKTAYARHLAEAVLEKRIDLENLINLPDAEVKTELTKLKGVGDWTSDIYLLMAMLRPDVMPKGDLALHAAWQKLSNSTLRPHSDEFLVIAERWKPFRSAAARLLWHFYLSEKQNNAEARALARAKH
jgi:3-methyladenine DNA glycosylase/8-oxoguanine DNA glycosylase